MGRMIRCRSCGDEMARSAPFCPRCGADHRKGRLIKGNSPVARGCDGCLVLALLLLLLLGFLFVLGYLGA